MRLKRINKDNFLEIISGRDCPWHQAYLAMYSSQWKGITTDPDLMLIPVDDHLVHRADGVFEAMRCVDGRIYLLEAHLQRLQRSADAIKLDMPPEYSDIIGLIKATVIAGGQRDCLIRVVLSRGPGSFSANPFDCHVSQTYINVIKFHPPPKENYEHGVSVITSSVPIKASYFANIKSCDYLPNVLMKMEAINMGADYSIAFDEEGFLAEGSTENVVIIDREGNLKVPEFERTLAGTTVKRLVELSKKLVEKGRLKQSGFYKIRPSEVHKAREIFLCGTSIGMLPVVEYDGHRIGTGQPGPIFRELSSLLWKDMTQNKEVLTEVWAP